MSDDEEPPIVVHAIPPHPRHIEHPEQTLCLIHKTKNEGRPIYWVAKANTLSQEEYDLIRSMGTSVISSTSKQKKHVRMHRFAFEFNCESPEVHDVRPLHLFDKALTGKPDICFHDKTFEHLHTFVLD